MRSSSTMSAPLRSNSVRACGPVVATATSKPSLRSMYDSASEKDSSSSTTSTRTTCLPFLQLDLHAWGQRYRQLWWACRQPQREPRTRAHGGLHLDPSSVVDRDVLDDGQAQPGAAGVAGAG